MIKATRSALRPLAILIVPAHLAACSIPLPGGSDRPEPSLKALAERIPRVDNSPAAPCWQQEQIASQNAYLDAQIRGKAKPYVAPCKAKPASKKPAGDAGQDPKTS